MNVITLLGISLHQLIGEGLFVTIVFDSICFLKMLTLYKPSVARWQEMWSSPDWRRINAVSAKRLSAKRLSRSEEKPAAMGLDVYFQLFPFMFILSATIHDFFLSNSYCNTRLLKQNTPEKFFI